MNLRSSRAPGLRSAIRYLGAAALLLAAALFAAAATARSQGILFQDFLNLVNVQGDSVKRQAIVDDFVFRIRARGSVVTEDSTVFFLHKGNARCVQLAGDINGWKPDDSLTRIPKTDLFYLPKTLDPASRFEYKFVVDSVWTLDQLNARVVIGGYGPNSEVWMPRYRPPTEIEYRPEIAHGTLDSLNIRSRIVQRTHPVFVYLPSGYRADAQKRYPTIFVTDGGEYITLALMLNVLDNMIAEKRIRPIIAVFVDPRTDINDSQTSKRMNDYSMSDAFVNFMVREVRARLIKKYRMLNDPTQTAIMGASLGGLISTYAAFTRPDVFGLCAAQSPSFWWKKKAIIRTIASGSKKNIKFYIDTGTIRDAQAEASEMRDVLKRKGYRVHYEENPEGHNWVNWRARIPSLLSYFWGTQ